ncbi:nitroreductase family deazaflavin-dependent oxidoreductase [Paractinoplanes deccanensis]|nr:nitroreductase family deazaflavin-dependent oxidoreductase [Actinoplanes deccanensis]
MMPWTRRAEPEQPTADMDLAAVPDDGWRHDQARLLATADEAGTTDAIKAVLGDVAAPLVVLTTRGARTGREVRTPLIRVEHDGRYAVIASKGGNTRNPAWYHNAVAHPEVELWDGTAHGRFTARPAEGAERDLWWDRAAAVWPSFTGYRAKTDRHIPVLILTPEATA